MLGKEKPQPKQITIHYEGGVGKILKHKKASSEKERRNPEHPRANINLKDIKRIALRVLALEPS